MLAWWAAGALGDQADLLWLAAVGLIGDMAEGLDFPKIAEAQARWGKTALRDATSLVNAPRRTAAADAGPALRLLLASDGPKCITKGDDADALALHAAKTEVRAAMDTAKRVPPAIGGDVALISLDSPCQIHPLIAQQWRGRLKDKIVIAANAGYRPGWVHFAARSASGRDLIAFLAEHRPGQRRRALRQRPHPGDRRGATQRRLERLHPRTRVSPSTGAGMTTHDRPLRLGFPVKVMGRPDLKSQDTRRWQKDPHLKCSLELLDHVLDYLKSKNLDMYRMSSDIAPYATHPDMPQFHNMVAESDAELRAFGAKARAYDIRLSFHPSQYVLLNAPNPELTKKSIWDLSSQAEMLDRMELDDGAVMITHVGGVYDDHKASRARWVDGWNLCPEHVKRRLVLENDDLRFSAADVLWIHERTGVRLIFDYQHFWCPNPERLDMRETFERFLATWPAGVRPKMHFSSPRTELREIKQKITPKQREAAKAGKAKGKSKELLKAPVKATARVKTVLRPPVWTGHADFTNPFEFATFMRMAEGLVFDVMLEGKSKDLSLLRLRPDLLRFAPDVAARFGITAQEAMDDEEQLEEGVDADEETDVDEGRVEAAE